MKVKDKAQELIKKFMPLIPFWDYYLDAPRDLNNMIVDAKNCALIAVEELINDCNATSPFEEERLKYWNEVKSELEFL